MDIFDSIEHILRKIKKLMDEQSNKNTENKVKVLLLYAVNASGNASGKTRLSKLFDDLYQEKILYYNAFTEDLFSWDNDLFTLKFDKNIWIFKIIQEQGLDQKIVDNFKKFTGAKLEPEINIDKNQVTFNINTGDEKSIKNIKISRGEESVFIWSIFYTILDAIIEELNENSNNRSTKNFDKFKYVVIDDPVSSMDDTRIITIALELAKLIATSKNQLKFLITTHHALFFNVLFNVQKKNWDKKAYIMSKSDAKIQLKSQANDSPFAYHHVIIDEIEEAIKNNKLKKYHFNLFRTILEKTANFLGYSNGWKKLLPKKNQSEVFIKNLNHYSHDSLSDLEAKDLSQNNIKNFKETFDSFIREFNWKTKNERNKS